MIITWSIHDDGGTLVGHGVHRFATGGSGFIAPPAPIDPYEPALAVAQSVETALINYLPDAAARIVRHDPADAVSIAISSPGRAQ